MSAARDVLDEAVSASGLDDFGDDSFREGLEILVESLRSEARLNAIGEFAMRCRFRSKSEQVIPVEK